MPMTLCPVKAVNVHKGCPAPVILREMPGTIRTRCHVVPVSTAEREKHEGFGVGWGAAGWYRWPGGKSGKELNVSL